MYYYIYFKYLTWRYWTTYEGLVNILLDYKKDKKRAHGHECFCDYCTSDEVIMYAYYYSYMYNNNIEHGSKILRLIDTKTSFYNIFINCLTDNEKSIIQNYQRLGAEVIEQFGKGGIKENMCIFWFYVDLAHFFEKDNKIKVLNKKCLKLIKSQLKHINNLEYDPTYPYDDWVKTHDADEVPFFTKEYKINQEVCSFYETF